MNVPIIAVFGAKGGVGKTTITRRFVELVTQAEAAPSVLAVDFDVDQPGMTATLAGGNPLACKTIHDYIAARAQTIDEALDLTSKARVASRELGSVSGQLYLIPAANPDSMETFRTMATIDYQTLLEITRSLINDAVTRYDISCVLIDCGPTINPYTAAAVHLSDRAFIIGENVPVCYQVFQNFATKIREFYPGFSSTKVGIILNKVRGSVPTDYGFFAVIPFTMEVVDITEGIEDVNMARLILFDQYILEVVRKTFEITHPHLVPGPEVILPAEWIGLVKEAPKILRSRRMKLLGLLGRLLPVGGSLAAGLAILKFIFNVDKFTLLTEERLGMIGETPQTILDRLVVQLGITQPIEISLGYPILICLGLALLGAWFWSRHKERASVLRRLEAEGASALLTEFRRRSGRRVVDGLRKLARH